MVCNELLERIEDGKKSVLATTPDYETNPLVHSDRRLWQRKELQASEKQDLTRRFAQGYKQLLLHCEGGTTSGMEGAPAAVVARCLALTIRM